MRLTNRDKVLLVVLPAIVVFGGYGYWINSSTGKQTEMTRLQKSVDDANRSAPPKEEILAARSQQSSLGYNVRKMETDLAQYKKVWDECAGQAFDPATRNHRVSRLDNLLVHHGLTLIADAPAETATGGTNEVRTPAALEAFAKAIAERSPQFKPKTWRVRLYGRYPDVMGALSQLAEGEALCVPIGLTMKEWNISKPAQEWTLLVWI